MKKFAILLVAMVCAVAANAQVFFNSTHSSSLSGYSGTTLQTGSTYELNLSGFTFTGTNAHSLAWTFDFAAGSAPFYGVQYIIEGSVTNGVLEMLGTEEVKNTGVAPAVTAGQDYIYDVIQAGVPTPFTRSVVISFSPNLSQGFVSKDMLFSMTGSGAVTINKVTQRFLTVPEPGSLMALGLGLLLLRRRK